MTPRLQEIAEALARARLPLGDTYRATELGLWACTQMQEVHDLFVQIDLDACDHLADLGSGDGRVVLVGSLFTRATGIEIHTPLISAGRRVAAELGLTQADFIRADCREVDLAPYDLLYIYPDKPLDWLEDRLAVGWPGRLLVYGPYFQPQGLRFIRSLYAGATHCTLWSR